MAEPVSSGLPSHLPDASIDLEFPLNPRVSSLIGSLTGIDHHLDELGLEFGLAILDAYNR